MPREKSDGSTPDGAPLRPFFGYFGGKWRAALHYPAPRYDLIVEPFAGSAGYSLRYAERQVVLVERNPIIASIWRYLINADPARVLALGDTPQPDWVPAERALAGMWFAKAPTAPRERAVPWAAQYPGSSWWGPRIRARIASQLPRIRHWTILECDAISREIAAIGAATWFVDPPYFKAGKHYPCGSANIDYSVLGKWCRALRGQVLVCESSEATWLSFAPLAGNHARLRHSGKHREAIWQKDDDYEPTTPHSD